MSPVITKARFMDGLVLWLPMTEGAGTTVKDLSKYGNNGTFGAGAAAPSWVAGRDGLPGVEFDTDEYIDCGAGSSLDFGTDPFTVSCRFKTTNVTAAYVAKGVYSEDNEWHIYTYEDGKVAFATHNDYTTLKNPVATHDDEWHQVVVVRESNDDGSLYVDGILVKTAVDFFSGYELTNTKILTLGARDEGTAQFLDGLLDDILIYNRALDPYEVRAAYEAVRKI